jgi:uncharacterized protein CbrC (UPF0167 family)
MIPKHSRKLSEDIEITCYSCGRNRAVYLSRIRMAAVSVQVCLCSHCIHLDTIQLLERTLGIGETELENHTPRF